MSVEYLITLAELIGLCLVALVYFYTVIAVLIGLFRLFKQFKNTGNYAILKNDCQGYKGKQDYCVEDNLLKHAFYTWCFPACYIFKKAQYIGNSIIERLSTKCKQNL